MMRARFLMQLHPRNGTRSRQVIVARVLLAVLCGSLLVGCEDRNKYQPPPPAEVGVAKPQQRAVTLYLELTGNTSAFNKVDLVARVQGFLQKVDYKDGDRVAAGTTLFEIERAPYETSLQIAEATQRQQEALLVQAEADLERQTTLQQRQAASAAKLDESRSKRDSTIAALEQAKGQVQQAKINLDYTLIKAPFAGIVTARLVDPGALVGAGGPTKLATIVQIDPIYVNFSVNEQQVLQIRDQLRKQGLTVKDLGPIPVDVGVQTETGFPHKGVIDYIAPDLDQSTGVLPVRARLENKDAILLPGLFVRVRVPVQRDVPSLLVPDRALGNGQLGRYLLVVNDKNVVEQRPVETGEETDGGLRIIKGGLKLEDRVVVNGIQRAIPGNIVKPVDATIATGPAAAPATPAPAPAPPPATAPSVRKDKK
jgi:RND family efflux transporter MFP subunit